MSDAELRDLERSAARGGALEVERYHAALTRLKAWGPFHVALHARLREARLYPEGRYLSWREKSAPRIAFVLEATRTWPPAERKQAIFDAYPFGQRANMPYKIWLDEVARQEGRKPTPRRGGRARAPEPENETTRSLFP